MSLTSEEFSELTNGVRDEQILLDVATSQLSRIRRELDDLLGSLQIKCGGVSFLQELLKRSRGQGLNGPAEDRSVVEAAGAD